MSGCARRFNRYIRQLERLLNTVVCIVLGSYLEIALLSLLIEETQ